MRAFVTVGSTKFDALIQKVSTDEVLSALQKRGYTEIVVQCGNSTWDGQPSLVGDECAFVERAGVRVEYWKFKPSLGEEYNRADLVISHAGSGTILDVLRKGKPIIAVPNPTLLHNHQQELADVLAVQQYLQSTDVHDLARTIEGFNPSNLVPFPQFDGTRFAGILDETMGFDLISFLSPDHHQDKVPKLMTPKALEAVTVETENPADFESQNVHNIYDAIASHFSSTRYKPWPIIAAFLNNIPTGWVGLDSGTGNGKYLPLPLDRPGKIMTLGMDMSRKLLEIAQTAGGPPREVVQGNVIDNPWRTGIFDYAISIATIHHLATPERRKLAVQRIIEAVAPDHGRAMIYVWAIEQDELSKRLVQVGGEQTSAEEGKDVIVPWVLSKPKTSPDESVKKEVYNRYYHMFSKGELPALVAAAAKDMGLIVGGRPTDDQSSSRKGLEIVEDGWERSNYYVEIHRWTT